MHAIRSGSLMWMIAVMTACGSDSRSSPQSHGGPGGDVGTDAPEGAGGGTSGGTGSTPNAGGTSGTGAAPAADGSGGSASTTSASTTSASTTSASTASASTASASTGGAASGGAASGGAASGSTSTLSGIGGAPLMEPPPNCESVSQSEGAETCAYEYTCDGQTHFDSCQRDSDGVWACECGTFSTPKRYFEIEGVEALEACGMVARICERDEPVSPERTCRFAEPTVDEDLCSAEATCGNALDLGPDIVARKVAHYRSRCRPTPPAFSIGAEFMCSNDGDAVATELYRVTAPSIADVCAPMLEFGVREEPPTYVGQVCGFGLSSGVAEQGCPVDQVCQACLIEQQCSKTAQIEPDVTIISGEISLYRYVICRPEQGGASNCTCETDRNNWNNDSLVSWSVLEMCEERSDVCPD